MTTRPVTTRPVTSDGVIDITDARQALFAWIERKAKGLEGGVLTGTTPLLSARHLRSLQIPELLLYLEELRGSPVDVTQLRAGDFEDIDTICARFLTDPAPQGPPRGKESDR
jgi:hypothetical protein